MAKFKEPEEVSQELSARDELYELANSYRRADVKEKDSKKAKESIKGPMLELMTDVVREEIPLARETHVISDDEVALFDYDWKKWCERNYPEWRVVNLAAMMADDPGTMAVTIEENEDLKKFEFVVDGFKYGRTIAMVEAQFFAEAFYNEIANDEEAIVVESDEAAEAAMACIKVATVVTYTLDEDAAEAAIADYPELVPIFQRHSTLGKPQVRLIPIKAAKEEV